MQAEDLMTTSVCTCAPEDSLEQAARLMWEEDVGCVVVTNPEERPVGIITDRDIAMAAYTQGLALRDSVVASAMAKDLVTCAPETSLGDLESRMRSAQIRRVPVVTSDGSLVGIVTLGDIAKSSQSSPMRLSETPGLAKTLAAVIERRARAAAQ